MHIPAELHHHHLAVARALQRGQLGLGACRRRLARLGPRIAKDVDCLRTMERQRLEAEAAGPEPQDGRAVGLGGRLARYAGRACVRDGRVAS